MLGISNQDALSEDLESDPFLNSALQRFTCELYHRFGSFLAPLSVGIITNRHSLSSIKTDNRRTMCHNFLCLVIRHFRRTECSEE